MPRWWKKRAAPADAGQPRPNPRRRRHSRAAPPRFEPLEPRLLFSVALPTIDQIFADNRGRVELHVDGTLNPATVRASAVTITTPGADRIFGTADDVDEAVQVSFDAARNRIRIDASVAANTRYRVQVDGDAIRSILDAPVDAEFNGPGVPTGDGVVGGDLVFFTAPAAQDIARFFTPLGEINVLLSRDLTPITVQNFISIANRGDFDGTIFHRLVPDFVIQGGGFKADPLLAPAPAVSPIQNEPVRSNTRGTIAMAKRGGDPNSATNQWFFNLGDNSANLDQQNSGFTVFGEITDSAGLMIVDALAALRTFNASALGSAFSELPILDSAMVTNASQLTPADLAVVERIALQVDLSATPPGEFAAPSVVFESARGAKVFIFDLSSVGVGAIQDAVSVNFGSGGLGVESITLREPLTAAKIGVAISGARAVGHIRDLRTSGDIGFIVSAAPVASIRTSGAVVGADIAGKVVGGLFVPDDPDGDGKPDASVGVFIDDASPGGTPPPPANIHIDGDLLGDLVVNAPVASLNVSGAVRGVDVRIDPASSEGELSALLDINASLFQDVNLLTTQSIATLRLGEWRDDDLVPDTLTARSAGKIITTGKGLDVRNGDFEADATLVGDVNGLSLGRMRIAGVAFSASLSASGSVGRVVIREGATAFTFAAGGDARSLRLGPLSATQISATGAIGAVIASEWIGGSLNAASVGRIITTGRGALITRGDLSADITISAGGIRAVAARAIRVAGDVGAATWSLTGNVGAIAIAGDVSDAAIRVNGSRLRFFRAGSMIDSTLNAGVDARSVRVVDWSGGTLAGGAIRRFDSVGDRKAGLAGDVQNIQATIAEAGVFHVRGDLRNAQISFTKNAFFTRGDAARKISVNGAIDATTIRALARIGSLAADAMRVSSVFVGTAQSLTGFPTSANELNLLLGSIGSITILGENTAGFAVSNVFFVAPRIGAATLGSIETVGAGAPWGLAAAQIKAVSLIDSAGQTVILDDKALREPHAFGEFQIRPGFAAP